MRMWRHCQTTWGVRRKRKDDGRFTAKQEKKTTNLIHESIFEQQGWCGFSANTITTYSPTALAPSTNTGFREEVNCDP